MVLEELRKKALYQNSIEIWIGISEEKKIDWVNTDNYQKFIAFLLKNELNMKQMTICFDESDNASYGGHSKKVFANNLAAINDVNSHCYSIKLKDTAIELINKVWEKGILAQHKNNSHRLINKYHTQTEENITNYDKLLTSVENKNV